ncbi:non-ribosomal peptide synthetase [Methylovulum psychrotolerans]|uniref:Non-ribosomal peptide synthetase n=1 Tax=Methylovulum psychrotolerans TaxID=1704499 RepID=A0A2S5CFR5_9GAMM|nr:non-ribosomal peptide synthetase [Methylovulum psychrotolerans]
MGLTPEHLAYVIYTSGSTGQPKGVINGHRGVVNRLCWAQQAYGLSATDRVLQKTPFSFDVSVWEFFLPLLAGAQLVIAKPHGHQDPAYLAQLLVREQVSMVHFVPSMLQVFLDQADLPACPALRRVLCSGEALPHALQMRLHRLWPDVELHNLYGPTEAAVDVTAWQCRPEPDLGIVPIGYPIANTQIYILDSHLQPVPLGVAGEIHIGGIQVARGYLNRPALTAERFITDPFRKDGSGRLYKTGDLGRWLPNGSIEYLGRNDFQVKIRGLRIELGEIETRLAACQGIREAVVIAREDVPGDKRLIAYLIPEPDHTPDPAELRRQLAGQLADYMLPAAFVTLEQFPLSTNGKLDRRALPAPDGGSVAARAYEAPQGTTETVIAALWQELLHLEQVGRHDQFFELGGHSLLIVSFIERLRQQGLSATVRSVFTAPTLAELAAQIDAQADPIAELKVPANLIAPDCTALTPDLLPLVKLTVAELDGLVANVPGGAANIQDIYPLAPLQEGILFHHLLAAAGDAYLLRTVLSFADTKGLAQFLAALQQVIDRHDILRTAIHWQGLPQPVQVVQRRALLPITELSLQGTASAMACLLGQTDPSQLRLNLQQAPLFAAYSLYDAQTDSWLLALLNHHLVSDHLTVELIIGEVGQILAGQAADLPRPLPYRQFIAQTLATPSDGYEAYFKARLADITEPTAPFGIMDGQGRITEAKLALSADLAAAIRLNAKRYGLSPAVLFHAAWAQVLAHCTGRDDVVFATVLLGRLQGVSGADRVLGLFINTLPLRIRVGGQSAAQLVTDTGRQLLDLLAYEQASLALAQRCSGVAAPLPLFTSLLNYRHSTQHDQQAGQMADAASTWQGIRVHHSEERTNYPLTVSVDDLGVGFTLTAQCSEGIVAERIVGYFGTALAGLADALAQQPDYPACQLSILPAAERRQVLQAFNGTTVHYPPPICLQQLFEQHAADNPNAPALVFGSHRLSYAELNRQANQLAHHLIAFGIRPDDRVAIALERCPDMVVALLAIFKAGGAYLPLDLSYPDERLAYMLADSRPTVLLTQTVAYPRLLALADEGLPIMLVDVLLTDGAGQGQTGNPDPQALGISPQNLAYIIYTSGSTGQPKGVAMPQAALLNLLNWQFTRAGLPPGQKTLQFAALGFDVAFQEIFSTLGSGACLVLVSDAVRRDPVALLAELERQQVQRLFVPFIALQQLAEAAVNTAAELPYLHDVITAGEQLRISPAIKAFIGRMPGRRLHNHYGPTETHVVTALTLADDPDTWPLLPPIGRPIANSQIYVLDSRLQPVPLGVAGEIYIGGANLARGYFNRPELTAERFIDNPFRAAGDPPGVLYKTGDLGCWRSDGTLDYLGRNDFQVKIRGFRIELGEIEAQLCRCAGVCAAVVVAHPDGVTDKRLVAYLVADLGQQLDVAAVRQQLASQLADYMLPAVFVVLDSLPLSPNGKLDRKALPEPEGGHAASRLYESPQNDIEQVLAAIWQDLLHLDKVGRHDNFFDLGGHSLLAVQLVVRLREAWQIDVPLAAIFEQPSLMGLAECVLDLQLACYQDSDIALLDGQLSLLSEAELRTLLSEDN